MSGKFSSSVIAGILIAAGLLKASNAMAFLYSFGFIGFSTPWSSLPIAMLEIALGVFLLRHPTSHKVWIMVTAVFTAFLFSNIFAIIEGKHSCNCFGSVVSRPFYVAALDLFVLVLCVAWLLKNKSTSLNNNVAASRLSYSYSSTGLVAAAFIVATFSLIYSREALGVSPLIGLPPVIGQIVTDAEQEKDRFAATLSLSSRSSGPVVLHGMRPSCSISVEDEFPIKVGKTFTTSVSVHCRGSGSEATVNFVSITLLVESNKTLSLVTLRVPVLETKRRAATKRTSPI